MVRFAQVTTNSFRFTGPVSNALEQEGTMSIPKLLVSEITVAFFIGALPLFIVVNSNPNSKVVESLSSLNPGDPVVMYLFYLLLLNLGFWVINKFILKSNVTASDFISAAHRLSHQVGFTIHSIYRTVAGAIPSAIGLLAYKHGVDSKAFIVSVESSFLVLGSLFMCCLLTWLSERTAPKQKWL